MDTFELQPSMHAFETPIGWCALCGNEENLLAVSMGHRDAQAAIGKLHADPRLAKVQFAGSASRWARTLGGRIAAMLEGEPDDFRDVPVALDHVGPFTKRVLLACRKIGWGQTASYAELARTAGSPGAARAVGQAMAGNRTPLVVPCHRVVASGGRLGGFSAPQGLKLKQWLLDLEQSGHGINSTKLRGQGRFFSSRGKKFSKILA